MDSGAGIFFLSLSATIGLMAIVWQRIDARLSEMQKTIEKQQRQIAELESKLANIKKQE